LIFLSKQDNRSVPHNRKACSQNLFGVFDEAKHKETKTDRQNNFDVCSHVSQHPYNPCLDVKNQLPVYTKTPKSEPICGSHYIIRFEKGWQGLLLSKMITPIEVRLQRNQPKRKRNRLNDVAGHLIKPRPIDLIGRIRTLDRKYERQIVIPAK
jgi:hypothetical protein